MAPTVTYNPETGQNEFVSDGRALLIVGPHISGHVTTADGTRYSITPEIIEVDSDAHATEVAHLIGQRFVDNGHPLMGENETFLHHCTPACGEHALSPSDPFAAAGAELAQRQTSAIIDAGDRAAYAEAQGTGGGDNLSLARAAAAAENAALNGLDGTGSSNVIPYVSLHTADPGTTGASENANAGSYARQACTWNTASGGAKTNSTSLTFATAGSAAVSYFGTWSSATYGGGNYALGGALTSPVTATSITFAPGSISLGVS